MDWLVDREDVAEVNTLAADLEQYLQRHGERSTGDAGDGTTRTLHSLLDRVCRCEGSLARVELEWRTDQPTLTVLTTSTGGHQRRRHTASCEVRAAAQLPVRRHRERSFVLEPHNPHALPTPHEFGPDGWVAREPFLKALVVEATGEVERHFGPNAIDAIITKVGGDIGNRMEDHYRRARGIVERLTPEQMGELFVGLKHALGGDFYVIDSNNAEIILGNRRCPFGEEVRSSPGLCRMTSSVFGGIAARNVGFAAVCLDERIAVGDRECRVRVILRPDGTLPSHAHWYGPGSGLLRVAMAVSSTLVRESIAEALSHQGIEVVSSHDHPGPALQDLAEIPADVLLIDVPQRETANAVDMALSARDRYPRLAVVVLSEHPDLLVARRLIAAGPAVGHLLKDATTDIASFVALLRAVADGGTVFSPAIAEAVATSQTNALDQLTRRELDVLALVADGYSNHAIADRLSISKRAVEKHLGNVFRKLNLSNDRRDRRVQAGLIYRDSGHAN